MDTIEVVELDNFDFTAKPEYEGKIIISRFTDASGEKVSYYSILYQKNSAIYTLASFFLTGFDVDDYVLKMKDLAMDLLKYVSQNKEGETEEFLDEDEICTEGHVEVVEGAKSDSDKLYSLALLGLGSKFSADDLVKLREKGII